MAPLGVVVGNERCFFQSSIMLPTSLSRIAVTLSSSRLYVSPQPKNVPHASLVANVRKAKS